MSTPAIWDPFKELDAFNTRLSRLLDHGSNDNGSFVRGAWAPLVDITEDEHGYTVSADIPAVEKEDVKVSVENGQLVVRGERKREAKVEGRKYHRTERSYGSFYRSFSLPDDADAQKVDATFKNGVLTIHLAKAEEAKPRSIDIKVD